MARDSLYPPSPDGVPDDLAAPSPEYRSQVYLTLLVVALFLAVYLALMLFSALLLAWAVFAPLRFTLAGPVLLLIRGVVFVPALLMFVYLLKNLFKWEKAAKTDCIEIFEDEHPKLFDFLHRCCDEVGADYPEHVYVNYDVNASARQNISFLNLIVPAKWSLVLGFGLINRINLTEFKALLAHEFGHFCQKDARLDQYVVTIKRTIYYMVYGRDVFDRFIDAWRRLVWIVSWPAWVFYGALWLLHRLLMGMYSVVAYFDRHRMRQGEFHADLIAASVTGSDAPVHLLYRSEFSGRCLNQAIGDLKVAMDHDLYTDDLFYQQNHAANFLRRTGKDPQLGEPPALHKDPDAQTNVFEPNDEDDDEADNDAGADYHPSNYDRERNVKETYIRTDFDERSPWLLFDDPTDLRERVTFKFYRFYFKVRKDTVLDGAERVQAFIDEEHAEVTYDARYQGLYDKRNLEIADIYGLAKEARESPWTITQLSHAHSTLYGAEVKHRAQLYNGRIEEFNLLRAIVNGWFKPKRDEFEYRGEVYHKSEAKRLFKKVDRELGEDIPWLKEIDRKVFLTYFQMALHQGQNVAEDLFLRYRFHLDLQKIWKELKAQDSPVNSAIAFLQSNTTGTLQSHHFQEALGIFREAHHVLRDSLRKAEDMPLPPLKNVTAGEPLRPYLLEKKLLEGLSKYEQSLNFRWINKLVDQHREVIKKVDRIHFKSMGGILGIQQRIGEECLKEWSRLPSVAAAKPPTRA